MSERPRRPAAVWGTQIILGLFNIMFFVMWLFGLSVVVSRDGSFGSVIWSIAWGFFINSIFFLPGFGLIMRKNWGRWSGTIILGLVIAGLAISQIARMVSDVQSLPSGPAKSGYLIGSFIGFLIFCGIPAYLVYRMITADAVYDFFNRSEGEVPVDLPPPPPPPTFDQVDPPPSFTAAD